MPLTTRVAAVVALACGIRDQWDLRGMSGGRMDDVITQDDLFRLVTRQRALNFSPGAEYLYSNSGFMLLAKIVERVGGKPFPTFLRERVFEPLGMHDTRVHTDHEEIVPGRAYSYATRPEGGYRVTSGRVRDERFVRQTTPTPNDSTP